MWTSKHLRWMDLNSSNVIWCSAAWHWYMLSFVSGVSLRRIKRWKLNSANRSNFTRSHFPLYDVFLHSTGNFKSHIWHTFSFRARFDISFSLNHRFLWGSFYWKINFVEFFYSALNRFNEFFKPMMNVSIKICQYWRRFRLSLGSLNVVWGRLNSRSFKINVSTC